MNIIFRISIYLLIVLSYSCTSSTGGSAQLGKGYNHLANESSPYLLQHAKNPVDWYPWSDEALVKAKAENKLLVVSVGYSSCHWCHVMEHESFEDTTIARIMNENFVSIKVDREERPDVDDVYMTACQMASGRGCGWPLNAFALPDGRPVWAGTYFPKDEWEKVLTHFMNLRKDDPEKLEEYATQLTEGIQNREKIEINTGKYEYKTEVLNVITEKFISNIDFKEGGRKGEPKFPMPNNYEFLLREAVLHDNANALEAVTITLDKMAMGGIYDQLGGGFSRYSVDGRWEVPHFEKMLYDNGQLISLYSKAYQVTNNPMYKNVVEQSLEFIEREMSSPEGGFYSSLDADSEGEEGKFYVWTQEELHAVITDEQDRNIFDTYYEIKKRGNWEEEKNILFMKQSLEELSSTLKLSPEVINSSLAKSKAKLMKERDKRIRPGLDDKVLTSWNALMLNGYIDAYRAFGNQAYLDRALKNANFLAKTMMQNDFRLNRNYKSGKSVINAFLDDYALLIDAFTNMYQVTFDEQWLTKAKGMTDYTLIHFKDKESGMMHYASDLDPDLIARKMELTDNVIPASNSIYARAIYKLGIFTYQDEFVQTAEQMLRNMVEDVSTTETPNFYSNWCQLYSEMNLRPYEVAIVGADYQPKLTALQKRYVPNALYLGGKDEGDLALLQDKLQEGETMIYVCQNRVCKLPVTEVEKAFKLMEN